MGEQSIEQHAVSELMPQQSAREYFLQQLDMASACENPEKQAAYERRLYMLACVEQKVEQMLDPQYDHRLWDEQVMPYQKTLNFLRSKAPDIIDDDLTAGGFLRLPTGFGKSILEYQIFDDLGVGTTPEPGQRRIRGLYLVPTVAILRKAAGYEPESIGLNGFLPHISTSEFYGQRKDLTGDVIVMTYDSFCRDEVRATLEDIGIDVVVCDEAHNLHALLTKEVITSFRKGKITFGYSATTEYDSNRPLTDILPNEVASYDTRQAIEAGAVSGVQILGFWTGCKLDVGRTFDGGDSDSEYTARELRPLAESPERNELILDLAAMAIEVGRRVVVSAIPGGRNAHAHLLARLAERRMILDPVTGHKRPIVAGVAEPKPRPGVPGLKQWHAGLLDVMTYTDYINQGWDSKMVNAMIMARPTHSRVFGGQGRGRGLRHDPHHPLTIYFELFDDISAGQYTMWHEVGEDVFDNTIITARDKKSAHTQAADAVDVSRFLGRTKKAHSAMRQDAVRESIIVALRGDCPLPPEGWKPITNLARFYSASPDPLRRFLVEKGFTTEVYKMPIGAPAHHTSPEAVRFLEAGGLPAIAADGQLTRPAIAAKFGVAYSLVEKAVRSCEVPGELLRGNLSGRVERHYSRAEQSLVRAWIRTNALKEDAIDDGAEFASDIAKEFGISATSIRFYLRAEQLDYAHTVTKGVGQVVLNKDQAARVREYFTALDRPDGYTGLYEIAQQTGSTPWQVRNALNNLGLSEQTKRFREERAVNSSKRQTRAQHGNYLLKHQAEQVKDALLQREHIPDMTVAAYAKSRGVKSARVLRATQQLGLELREVKRGKITNRYVLPHNEYALDREIGVTLPEWHAISKAASIVRCRQVELRTIMRLMGLERFVVTGEDIFIADEAVSQLFNLKSPKHSEWGDLVDAQAAGMIKYNVLLPLDDIHNHIWNGSRSVASFAQIVRDDSGKLQLTYRLDFVRQMILELAHIANRQRQTDS